MPYIPVPPVSAELLREIAEQRWNDVLHARADLGPAVALQRTLLILVLDLSRKIDGKPLPRLSLPPKYLAAKLARGVPAFTGEPIPLPVALLQTPLLALCEQLAAGGSWPALAEVVHEHRTLRCSFCATAWELTTHACIYCEEAGDAFVTAAPDQDRMDRRVELCSGCGSYLKTIDLAGLSAFPLL